jgi:hypothetical protein
MGQPKDPASLPTGVKDVLTRCVPLEGSHVFQTSANSPQKGCYVHSLKDVFLQLQSLTTDGNHHCGGA